MYITIIILFDLISIRITKSYTFFRGHEYILHDEFDEKLYINISFTDKKLQLRQNEEYIIEINHECLYKCQCINCEAHLLIDISNKRKKKTTTVTDEKR